IVKFFSEEELAELKSRMNAEDGDLLLFSADNKKVVADVLGNLRLKIGRDLRSEEHTSELQSRENLVCRLLLEKKKNKKKIKSYLYRVYPFFSLHHTATTAIYTLSLHDALPI